MSRVITFYSYKGGTGRSMALANVAWILASAGKRVLTIDWDLEAPGLHLYFHPFLTDKELSGQESQGVIDIAIDFAVRAATPAKQGETLSGNWYEPYADFSKWRQKLRWPSGQTVRLGKDGRGEIDFVPAGRQSADYAKRVNNFDWHSFYGKLGGGAFFDAAKGKFALYDYVLIDSRTGVSDTSGICTVQMPDTLVVCFTLNFQSIKGAAAVAQSVRDQRPKMRFLPVPMRIDAGEEKALNRMKSYAADVFTPFLDLNINREEYWFSMEVPYHARYAYAEKLALFEEQASITASTLPAMVRLSAYVTAGDVRTAGPLPELERRLALAEFEGVEPAEAPLATAAAQQKPIALPYLSLGSLFKGRDAFLADLHKSLNRGTGRTGIIVTALYGLGGIGKTRAAVEYAWAHQEDYSALLFVISETPEALRRNLAALVGPLMLNLPEQSATEERVRLKAALDWLSEHPGWLLILDNVDTPGALAEAESLLRTLSGGHVIITTRLANFAGYFDSLELDLLGLEDAATFLLERTDKQRQKMSDDAAAARQLVLDLGQLALALEQAGAYIAKLKLTFARYRQQWQDNWAKVAGWADPAITKYPRGVAVTWQTSVNQLSAPGRRLLERLAWLAPEPVPNFLIEVPVPDITAEDIEEALTDLAAYSLVRRNPQSQEFSVHRLVQDVTRRSLVGQERPPSLVEALGWINAAFPFDADDVRHWPQAEALAPHAKAVIEHAAAASISAPTARLMSQLGLLLSSKALFGEAEPLFRWALAISEKSYGPDHPEVATDLNNLAGLLRATNRLSEAEPLFRRALAIDEKSYGPDHPNVATDLNNLALLLADTNRLNEAEPLFRRALAIDEKNYGPDHPNVARDLNNLAELLRDTNRLSEAEPLFRQALAIDEKSYGSGHPAIATGLNNLGQLLRGTNRLSEAEPLFRRALAIDEKSYGPDHPTVARDLNNLASLLWVTNRLSEAEPLFRRALAIDEKSYGPDHPTVATGLNNLAELLRDTNRLSEAEPLFRRALAIDEKSYGHANVARDLRWRARGHRRRGP